MSVEQFIDQIAGKGLLDETLLQRLRRDATADGNQWTPQDVVKFLVDQGHLTRFQAKSLVKELQNDQPAAHESLDLARSESIDGLSIGVMDDHDDDEEVIDLEAAMPAAVSGDSANNDDDVVDLSQANALQSPVQPTNTTATQNPVQGMQPETHAMQGQLGASSEAIGGDEAAVYGYDDIPTTLLDKQFNNQIWDRRFLYATCVVLLLLVGGAGVFYFIINNKSADTKFDAALADYDGSQYQQAVVSMQDFANTFPGDERANEALALVHLSNIHLLVQSQQGDSIPEITKTITAGKDIPGFSSRARNELKIELPQFVNVFLTRAEATSILSEKKENYDLAIDALALIDLPGALGTTRSEPAVRSELESIDERMASVKRHIDRDTHLGTALNDMGLAVNSGDVSKAFDSRRELLDLYPELKGDQRLNSVLTQMIDTERSKVRKVNPAWRVSTELLVNTDGAGVTSSTRGAAIPGVQGRAVVLTGGNAVALNVADGSVAWQQFVGLQTGIAPIQIGEVSILVQQQAGNVLGVDSEEGKTIWKLELEPLITSLSAVGNHVALTLAAKDGGTLLMLDAANGETISQIETSIPLSQPPAFNQDQSVAYLVGDHSFVYAISLADGKCLDVYFLNHGVGAVPFAPVFVNGYLLLAQNLEDQAGLLTLKQEGQGRFAKSGEVVRLPGLIASELETLGTKVLLVTDSGDVRLYNVQSQDNLADPVLAPLAATTLDSDGPARYFVDLSASQAQVGARGMASFAVGSDGQLGGLKSVFEQDVIVASPLHVSGVQLLQRIRQGASSVTVSATRDGGPIVAWETELASLSDSIVVSQGNSVVTVDAQAQVFNPEVQGSTSGDESLTSGRGYSHAVNVGGNLVLQSLTGSTDVLVFDDVSVGAKAARVSLQGLSGKPIGPGVAFSGQLLVPIDDGQLAVFDVSSGAQSLIAYHPEKRPEEIVRWSRPALPSDNANSFVVMRGRQQLQKIGVNPEPLPHLELQSVVTFDVPVYEQVAAVGPTIYLIRRGRNNDEIVGLSYDTLEELNTQALTGRVTWGPYRVGDSVLVYTSGSRLYCFGNQQNLLWRSDKLDMTPVGTGIQDGEDFLMTGLQGTLWRVNTDDGTTVSQTELKQRVVGNPFVVDAEVWVPTASGMLSASGQE